MKMEISFVLDLTPLPIFEGHSHYAADKRIPAKVPEDGDHKKHQAVQDPKDAPVDLKDATKNVVDEILKSLNLFQNTLKTRRPVQMIT